MSDDIAEKVKGLTVGDVGGTYSAWKLGFALDLYEKDPVEHEEMLRREYQNALYRGKE